jgi:hypothetical protein
MASLTASLCCGLGGVEMYLTKKRRVSGRQIARREPNNRCRGFGKGLKKKKSNKKRKEATNARTNVGVNEHDVDATFACRASKTSRRAKRVFETELRVRLP